MPRLTTAEYWNSEWAKIPLSIRFDPDNHTHYMFDVLFQELVPKGDLRLLEIGVGGSVWPAYFQQHFGHTSFGIDYSAEGCASANSNYSAVTGENLRIVHGDILHVPFCEESFDVVYSLGVIEHFTNPLEVLNVAKRLLRPSGLLLTTIPNKAGLAGNLEKRLNPTNHARHNPLTAPDLFDLYRDLGLEDITVRYAGPISILGRLPESSNLVVKNLSRVKGWSHRLVFGPLYKHTKVRPNNRCLSYIVVACGRRGI